MNRPPMAHRVVPLRRARRVAWYLLIAILCAAIFIAWTAVPEPDLMAGYR